MQIPKQQILDMLRDHNQPGDAGKADQANHDLPEQVDTDNTEHQNLLQQFGVDPAQLLSKFASSKFKL